MTIWMQNFGAMDSHSSGFYPMDRNIPSQDSWIADNDLLLGINVMDIFSGFVPIPEPQWAGQDRTQERKVLDDLGLPDEARHFFSLGRFWTLPFRHVPEASIGGASGGLPLSFSKPCTIVD